MSGQEHGTGTQSFRIERKLKADLMGEVTLGILLRDGETRRVVRRDVSAAPLPVRPLAWLLLRREARALRAAEGVARIPRLLETGRRHLLRTYLPGRPLHEAGHPSPEFFEGARDILEALHARGVTHNDLHKEPNILQDEDGRPALVDFQLASVCRRRGAWFRMCVREDLRHLLKHKRKYCPEALTAEERGLLARTSWVARWWRRLAKGPYNLVTRRILRWRDNEGRG